MIIVKNAYIQISADTAPKAQIKQLDRDTSYPIAGAEFSDAYRRHVWDGKRHMLRYSARSRSYIIPTGFLPEVRAIFDPNAIQDEMERPAPESLAKMEWAGPEPRGYQAQAVRRALSMSPPRGLLHLPIRSGKTLVAGLLIQKTGWKTVFLVASDILLNQTIRAFQSYIADAPVGQVGAGVWAPNHITVAMIQTLLKHPGRAKELLDQADLLIVDEVHHMKKAEQWRKLALDANCWAKIGLSATVYVAKDRPADEAAIWMRAVAGPVIHKVSMRSLIQSGHLRAPQICVYVVPGEKLRPDPGWRGGAAYTEHVVRNPDRNALIADLAEHAVCSKLRVLIDTGRIEQMRRIHKMLTARGISCEMIYGATPSAVRERLLKRFSAGDSLCLVGTILGEGVDVPELEVVINAEGLRSRIATIQRLRNLTACIGKQQVIVIDFADITQKHLRTHSRERLRVYQGTRGFRVRAVFPKRGEAARLPQDLLSSSFSIATEV